MMEYNHFKQIVNKHLFGNEKKELLEKIADSPERYIGLFRPTKPKAKVLQNLLQSHEIRFGDALEELLTEIIGEHGYKNLPKRIQNEKDDLFLDQYFTDGKVYYFIEQKIRDDHDSTKKRGQIDNFEKKLEVLYNKHRGNLVGIIYFIDPDLKKNKNYYEVELKKMNTTYGVPLFLYYGGDLFEEFFKDRDTWKKLLMWLKRWKSELPDLPSVNFDEHPTKAAEELEGLSISCWRRILSNDVLWKEEIINAIFMTGETLQIIADKYSKYPDEAHINIGRGIAEKIKEYYR